MTSWIQNLLANILNLNNSYQAIERLMNENNSTGVAYEIAKIIEIVFVFEPVDIALT